ncbi:MAG TPA: amidohydrolase [Aliidongia sp.]|uniref:M20 metallopeptidase family protein n=1 Tax=Aliidongia sp. TaxID=1914230 RepID=UPI002DDD94A9|nr:amidohydrolase [Aliidongia sp.]HEV2674013.1 amidohydrolase [Aliidongia sp.]
MMDGFEFDPFLLDEIVAARRHLHAHPELSNQETATQAFIAAWLGARGLEGVRPVAGTGIAVDIVGQAGASNRKLAMRADIDALPILEASGLPFSSTRPGVMHACGHDAHTAMALGAAVTLHRSRDQFSGTVRIIFQPGEEAEPLGGRRVVEEGLLDDVDGAIGIHVDPYLETGRIAVAAGPYTLASDIFDLVVHGRSAHAAKPSEGVDAIAIAAAIVAELQKLVSRETDAFDPLIVSVTGIQGGGSYNVLADQVMLKGTIRSGREATRMRAHRRVAELAQGIAASHGGTAEVAITRGEPPVVNDPEMVQLLSEVGETLLGPGGVLPLPGWTAADDFGFYSEKRPSVYFRLGIRSEPVGSVHPLHHPEFRVDEAALVLGASVLTQAAKRFLSR